MKKSIAYLCIALFLIATVCSVSAHANEVNSTNTGILVNGALSTGGTIFGVVGNSTSRGDLGTGTGSGFHFGALANFQMLAIGMAFSTVNYSTLEWSEEVSGVEYKYKSEGDGRYWTFDLIFGAKMFTESGDMGYTLPYIGYRFWKATRNQEDVTRNGIPYPAGNIEYELVGNGWIFGIRDFSTLSLGGFAIALQTGIWFYQAPMSSLKSNGNDVSFTSEQNVGFGIELGIGAALEDMGLSIIGGVKIDIQATEFKVLTFDFVAGAGYSQFFLALTYELSI